MSQCHFSNTANICIGKKNKKKQKKFPSLSKNIDHRARNQNRRNSRSSHSKRGSRWFEVLRVSGLRGGHEAYGKEMRLTPRDLQRGLKLTVLY